MLASYALVFFVIFFITSKFLSAFHFVKELELLEGEANIDCYAYADAHQLQVLYEIEEKDRLRWDNVGRLNLCLETGPILYRDAVNNDYCDKVTRQIVIDAENLNKTNMVYKVDIFFRSSRNLDLALIFLQWRCLYCPSRK
jgi:hypothetical protein